MKVLISAYACEPDRGSEPGAGWNWVLAAAREHQVWVITRGNNRIPIELRTNDHGCPHISFVYVDLPRWARFWKRGSRGIRLYYTLWQFVAALEARRLHRRERFDVVHHLTFANLWLPALTCLVDAPFVLGPVAGGQRVPVALYPALGVRGTLTEMLLLALRILSRLNPFVRLAWHRAGLILVNNEETRSALPRALQTKARLRPNACVEDMPLNATLRIERHLAIYAGRLHRFKGVGLAIRAIALLPDWRLDVIGEGPDVERLHRLARDLAVDDRIRFVGQVPQRELWRRLATCEALIFPSLKEGVGFVVAEAQALGTPVVALQASGPAALAKFFGGTAVELVPPRRLRYVVADLAQALAHVRRASDTAPRAVVGLDRVSNDIEAAYRTVLAPEEALINQASA